jgi:hypothetical protein
MLTVKSGLRLPAPSVETASAGCRVAGSIVLVEAAQPTIAPCPRRELGEEKCRRSVVDGRSGRSPGRGLRFGCEVVESREVANNWGASSFAVL